MDLLKRIPALSSEPEETLPLPPETVADMYQELNDGLEALTLLTCGLEAIESVESHFNKRRAEDGTLSESDQAACLLAGQCAVSHLPLNVPNTGLEADYHVKHTIHNATLENIVKAIARVIRFIGDIIKKILQLVGIRKKDTDQLLDNVSAKVNAGWMMAWPMGKEADAQGDSLKRLEGLSSGTIKEACSWVSDQAKTFLDGEAPVTEDQWAQVEKDTDDHIQRTFDPERPRYNGLRATINLQPFGYIDHNGKGFGNFSLFSEGTPTKIVGERYTEKRFANKDMAEKSIAEVGEEYKRVLKCEGELIDAIKTLHKDLDKISKKVERNQDESEPSEARAILKLSRYAQSLLSFSQGAKLMGDVYKHRLTHVYNTTRS